MRGVVVVVEVARGGEGQGQGLDRELLSWNLPSRRYLAEKTWTA